MPVVRAPAGPGAPARPAVVATARRARAARRARGLVLHSDAAGAHHARAVGSQYRERSPVRVLPHRWEAGRVRPAHPASRGEVSRSATVTPRPEQPGQPLGAQPLGVILRWPGGHDRSPVEPLGRRLAAPSLGTRLAATGLTPSRPCTGWSRPSAPDRGGHVRCGHGRIARGLHPPRRRERSGSETVGCSSRSRWWCRRSPRCSRRPSTAPTVPGRPADEAAPPHHGITGSPKPSGTQLTNGRPTLTETPTPGAPKNATSAGDTPAPRRSAPAPNPRTRRRAPSGHSGTAPSPTALRRPTSTHSTGRRPTVRYCTGPSRA